MAELEFNTTHLTKEEKYAELLKQIPALLDDRVDWVANSANFCSALKEVFDWFWIGFYRKVSEDYLQLGPFQGPVACTFIQKGKGVCGTVWELDSPLVVPNVDEFEGHIACSSLSKSEVVIPVHSGDGFWGVLDVDSEHLNEFDEIDEHNLRLLVLEFEKFL